MHSDTKLIIACLAQDKQAWDIFVEKYSRLICHAIVNTLRKYSTVPENQVVDDLFHTVFLSLIEKNYKKLRQFQWRCKLSSWLHMIAVRATIDYLRKQSKHLSLNGATQEEISLKENIISENPLPSELFEQKEEKRILEQIKNDMSTTERLFIELCYCRELSSSEIANTMNTSTNNVYQLKNRVRKKLKKLVEKIL
ncbi:MAG: sigma-70 family RNA polymerase sigma factor [Deltaproteobacteria bacterium]|nr:sigma-70 family RNA polymerase sigma factor [Deltaproteobacteria bacterium]